MARWRRGTHGGSYTARSDGLAGHQASGRHRCRALRRNGGRHPRDAHRGSRSRARINSASSRSRSRLRASSSCCSTRPSRRRSSSTAFRYSATSDWGRLRGLFRVGLAVKWGGGAIATAGRARARPVLGRRSSTSPASPLPLVDRRVHPARAGAGGHRRRVDDRRRPLRPPRDLRRARAWSSGSSVSPSGCSTASRGRWSGSSSGRSSARARRGTRGTASSRSTRPPGATGSAATGRAHRASSSSRASARRSSRCATRSPRSPSASSRRSTQVGYFRAAQAPITGLEALSAPVRLILLTEQTRDCRARPDRRDLSLAAALRRRRVARRARPRSGRLGADALARPASCSGRTTSPRPTPPGSSARGLPAARARLDEVVPRLDRQAGPADRRPRRRDRRRCSRSCSSSATAGARPARPSPCCRDARVRRRLGRAPRSGSGASTDGGSTRRRELLAAVNVLVVSGIWPPDVGGPASHAPDVARFLQSRGHEVEVVVTASARAGARSLSRHWTRGRCPSGSGTRTRSLLVWRRARRADVVYSTGMFGRSGIAAALARRPLVVKLTGDPAFERLRRRGVVGAMSTRSRSGGGGLTARALRQLSDRGAATSGARLHAERLPARSRDRLGSRPERVSVMPNPAPFARPSEPRAELRARFGLDGPTLAFGGRLTAQKSLDVMLAAVAAVPGRGARRRRDGEEREALVATSRPRARRPRHGCSARCRASDVLDVFAAADASVLSSSWENFPHSVVESLAVGTPVIATGAGGVAEVVEDGVNGLLVPVGDADALAAAVRPLLRRRGPSRRGCARNGRASVAALQPRAAAGDARARRSRRQPGEAARAVRRAHALRAPARRDAAAPLRCPLGGARLAPARHLAPRAPRRRRALHARRRASRSVSSTGRRSTARCRSGSPARSAPSGPTRVIVQGAQDTALALARPARSPASRVAVVFDVHGDWRHGTRVYGSPARRLLSPVADAASRTRRAPAPTASAPSRGYTTELVRARGRRAGRDVSRLHGSRALPRHARRRRSPRRPRALFVGVLERYKAVDVLAEAWRASSPRLPGAEPPHRRPRAARGHRRERSWPSRGSASRWTPRLPTAGVARALDAATLLVLPSRGEGMGRVVVEAFCRGRAVVGTRRGRHPRPRRATT